MTNSSLDTEEERWTWGVIIGGSSIAFVALSLAIRRICKRRSRVREVKKIVKSLYSDDDSGTATYLVDYSRTEATNPAPSAPSYEGQL